jgi:hypothetical protein
VEWIPGIRQGVGVTDVAVWDISADAAVVAIGAGTAALVAAVTAQARLRAQLKHDAEMRERDATREALNAVVTEITEAVGPMNKASAASRELFEVRCATLKAGKGHGLADAEERARESVQSLTDLRVRLMAASFQLHLRFPDTDPIIGRLAEWRKTFEHLAEDYQAALESSDDEMAERFETAQETATCLGARLNTFLTVARAWASDRSK